jgi:hypothetical protein
MSENVDKINFLEFLPNESYNLDFKTTKNLTINGKNFKKSVLTEENKENKEIGHIVYCDNGEINYILFTTGASNFVFHFETGVSLDISKEYSIAFSKDNDKTFLINSIDMEIIIEINEDYFFEYNKYFYYIVAGNCLSKNKNKEYYNNRGEGACLFDAFAQIFFRIDYDNDENEKDINYNHYNKVKETSLELRKIVAEIHKVALSNYNSYKDEHKNDPNFEVNRNIFDNINNYFSIKSDIKGSEGEKYIKNIQRDSVWGEDYEIQILSKYFNLNCNLIQDNINYAQMNINILNKEIEKNNPDKSKELTEHLQKANKELENAKNNGLKFFNQSKNDNYDKMYPFLDDDNNTYAYPYIFCNIGNNHWELKKHYCKLDFEKESTEAKKRFKDLIKGNYKVNKKKPSNDETQEIANIIKAIDVFINSGSSSSKPVDYSDEVVSVVGSIDGSSSSTSSTSTTNDYGDEVVDVVDAIDGSSSSSSTTNDYNDEVVDVLGALEQSSSSSSITGTTTASSSSSSVTSTTFIVSEEKTNLKNYFMKTSYIIKKGNKKYLFAEIINTPPVPTLLTNRPLGPYKEIYKNDEITITEFWQNKLIDTDQIGYIIEDGAEKYGVVPDFG